MAKRPRDWAEMVEIADCSTSEVALPEEVKNGVIKKAERSLGNANSPGPSTLPLPKKSRSGFFDIESENNLTLFPGTTSPFAAFSGFFKSTTASDNLFKPFENTIEDAVSSPNSKADETGDVNEEKIYQEEEIAETVPALEEKLAHNTEQKSTHNTNYCKKLQNLNESVVKSVELFLAKQTCCNLSPVFNDYKKHFDALNVSYALEAGPSREGRDFQISADEDASGLSADNKGSRDLPPLQDFEKDTDVLLVVGQEKLYLHRDILGSHSPVFAAMFSHIPKENSASIVHIDDCRANVFQNFINYVYTGEVNFLAKENVFELVQVAERFKTGELVKRCCDYMEAILSTDTFFDILEVACVHNCPTLLDRGAAFFLDETEAIVRSEKWRSFMREKPDVANELFLRISALKNNLNTK